MEKDTDALSDFQRLDIPAPAPGAFVERICAAEYTSGSESEILLAVYFKVWEGYQITLVYWDRNGTPGCMSSGVTTKILDGGWYINGDTILFCALDSAGTHACLFDLDSGVAASLPLPRAAKNTAWYSRDGQLCGVLLDMDGRLLHVTKEDSAFITAPLFANEGSNQQICNLDEIKLQQVGPSVHLWGRAGTSLWHFSDLQKSDNQPGELIIVAQGIQDFSTCPGTDAGYVLTACAANGLENGSDLTMYRVPSDSGVSAQQVSVDTDQTCETINCYLTEITLRDQDGSIMPHCQVELKTEQPEIFYIGDRQYTVSSDKPVTVTSGASGKLTIRQVQDNLAGVNFSFRIDGETDEYAVTPDKQVIETVRSLTAEQLANQILDDGSNLLNGTASERRQTAEQVECAVKSMLGQLSVIAAPADPTDRLDFDSRRFAFRRLPGIPLEAPVACMGRCHIVFPESGGISVEQITSDAHMEALRGRLFAEAGYTGTHHAPGDGLFSKLREFLHSVGRGFVRLTEMVVDKAKTVFSYIANGVKRVVEFVVKTVKDVVHCVCEVFHSIAVGFEKLIQWLGFLFNWDDIKRTKKYLEQWLDQQIAQAKGWIEDPQRMRDIDRIAAQLESTIDRSLDKLKRPLDIDQLRQGGEQDPQQVRIRDASSAGNLVVQKLQEPDACVQAVAVFQEDGFLDDVVQQLKAISIPREILQSLERDLSALASGGGLNAVVDMIVDLLKAVIHLALDAATAACKVLWAALSKLLDVLLKTLSRPIHIPVVSALLKLCGVELPSLKDIVLYMIAIPATVVYKMVYKCAPLKANRTENDGGDKILDVCQFLACMCFYITNDLSCASELADKAGGEPPEEKDPFVDTLSWIAAFSCLCWVMLDYVREMIEDVKGVSVCTWLCFVADILAIAFSVLEIRYKLSRSMRGGGEALLAAVYTVCAIIDCVEGKLDTKVEQAALVIAGAHDLCMSGRFFPGYAGGIAYGTACLTAVGAITLEGVRDLS